MANKEFDVCFSFGYTEKQAAKIRHFAENILYRSLSGCTSDEMGMAYLFFKHDDLDYILDCLDNTTIRHLKISIRRLDALDKSKFLLLRPRSKYLSKEKKFAVNLPAFKHLE